MSFEELRDRKIDEYREQRDRRAMEILAGNGIQFEIIATGELAIQTTAGKIRFFPENEIFVGAVKGRGIFPLLEAISRIEAEATK